MFQSLLSPIVLASKMEVCWNTANALTCQSLWSSDDGTQNIANDGVVPSNRAVQLAMQRLAKRLDLDELSLNQLLEGLSTEMGAVDLSSKRDFVQDCMISRSYRSEMPPDSLIESKTKELASRLDIQNTSLVKFVDLVSMELGADLEPKKDLIRSALYQDSDAKVMTMSMKMDQDAKSDTADQNDVEKQQIPNDPVTNANDKSDPQPESRAVAMFTSNVTVPEGPRKDSGGWRRSEDLPQGALVPEAAGLKWKDDHFASETNLIATFDHDYSAMIWFDFRIALLRKLPTLVFMISSLVVAQMFGFGNIAVLAFLVGLAILVLHQFGVYRLANSSFRALHVAVLQDGVLAVHGDHLMGRPIFAALFLDCFLIISEKREMVRTFTQFSLFRANIIILVQIPFDLITKVTVKKRGEPVDLHWIYKCCCLPCIRIPYDRVGLDSGSSDPWNYAQCMDGLLQAHKLHDLIWGMKRGKIETVNKNMLEEMRFSNFMQFGKSKTQPTVNATAVE